MPIEYGRKHGNGYHGNVSQKIILINSSSECTSEKVMMGRIKCNLVISQCPDTCDCFELCVAKSRELKKQMKENDKK